MNKTLQLNNLKTRTAMNAKISGIFICVEVTIYLLLGNFHDCIQFQRTHINGSFSNWQK